MAKRLPKDCIVSISYCKGIPKRTILEDRGFDVEHRGNYFYHLDVEKKGKEFRFRDEITKTPFGSWERVVEETQKILGDDLETISHVLTAAGIGKCDQLYDKFDVVSIYNHKYDYDLKCSYFSVDENEEEGGIGEFGLAALPKDRLDKTIAVYRTVVTDWDEEFPNDDHEFNDRLECLILIAPKNGNLNSTQEDIDLYKEFAEQGNFVAQCLLGMEYRKGILSEEKDSQKSAQYWLLKAIENEYTKARYLFDEDPLTGYFYGCKPPEYSKNSLLRRVADLDVNDCLIEIKLVENLNKETIFQNELFKLNDQSVKLHIYKHDGKIGLIQNNAVQYFENETEFVSACLHVTGSHLKVVTLVHGLAFCGLIDYCTLFDYKVLIGALGIQELNIFHDYIYKYKNYYCYASASLDRVPSHVLSKGFAISRRVAPEWKPGQIKPEFDEAHDVIAVVVDEYGIDLFLEDWELIQKLEKEGNPNAIMEAAIIYRGFDDSSACVEKSSILAKRALDLGCNYAAEFLGFKSGRPNTAKNLNPDCVDT